MKSLDDRTLEALAELICGDSRPWYRKGWELAKFFRNAGLKSPEHDGSTRKWWALDRLREYNTDPLSVRKVITRIVDPKEYVGQAEVVNEVTTELNQILAVEGLKVLLDGVTPKIEEVAATIPEPQTLQRQFAILTPDFAKLTNEPTLSPFLEGRWKEATKCVDGGAYLTAIILMGSILEGVLLAVVNANPKQGNQAPSAPKDPSGKVKRFGDWTLSDLIEVAHDCNWIQLDAKRFSHVLREYRNLVHPWEQRARNEMPDEDTCRICWEVIRAAINDIQKFKGN